MQFFFHFIFVFSILADSAQNVNALPQEKQKKRPLNGRLFVVFFGIVVKCLRDRRQNAVFVLYDEQLPAQMRLLKIKNQDLFKLLVIARGAFGNDPEAQSLTDHLLYALRRADLDRRAQRGDVDAHFLKQLF